MTDVNEWIKERRRIHASATEGPWAVDGPAQAGPDDSLVVYPKNDAGAIAYVQPAWDDADSIVDAHNMFPRALDALSAVLALCDQWDREAGAAIPGLPGVESDESFKIRLVAQNAIEGAINEQ